MSVPTWPEVVRQLEEVEARFLDAQERIDEDGSDSAAAFAARAEAETARRRLRRLKELTAAALDDRP